MRVLVLGAGGVGEAFARIAARRSSFEHVVLADFDPARAARAAKGATALAASSRRASSTATTFSSAEAEAGDERAVTDLATSARCDAVLNAVDPRFVMPVFKGALGAGATYLDMAMSLSAVDPELPYERTGVMLGEDQFAMAPAWQDRGLLALCGMGVEPGLSDVFARHAADNLFTSIEEIGVRDGADLTVD